MTSIVCIDTVIPAPVQSATDYTYDDIFWNRRFVEIFTETHGGHLTVDYSRFNDTEAAPDSASAGDIGPRSNASRRAVIASRFRSRRRTQSKINAESNPSAVVTRFE